MKVLISSDSVFLTKGVGRLRLLGYLEGMLDTGNITNMTESDGKFEVDFYTKNYGHNHYISLLRQRFPELTCKTLGL